MGDQSLYDDACQSIMDEADALNEVSQSIWSNPELNYEERHAHEVLCSFLEKKGFEVERSYKGIETGFKASWDNLKDGQPEGSSKAPHVVVISEYDALPEIGHACGHNLIAETGVAAGLAVKAAMEKHGKPLGKITVLGTPAEEGGGGKLKHIENGAFDDVDVALMVHPAPFNIVKPVVLSIERVIVTFKGLASHASVAPWDGVNALDAAVLSYNALSALRQQLKPTNRVHAVILKGGVKPNIIPDLTKMEVFMRALTTKDLNVVKDKVFNCFRGAAMTAGCEVEIDATSKGYQNMTHNGPLADLYEKHMKTLDSDWVPLTDSTFSGSTDMGNVSHVVPSIHPYYSIGTAQNHTREFTQVAGKPAAQAPTLTNSKAMAMIALDVMSDPVLLDTIKEDFKNNKEEI